VIKKLPKSIEMTDDPKLKKHFKDAENELKEAEENRPYIKRNV